MKIRYGEIDFYSKWLLDNLSLAGKKNRMRVKFLELITTKKQEFEKFRFQLIKEHSRLNEQGEPIVLNPDENGTGEADIIDREAFNKELNELILEEFVIEESEQNKDMLMSLKICIDECPIEWKGKSALEYEVVCKLFDNIYSEEK